MANGVQEQTVDQAELLAQLFPKDSKEYRLILSYSEKKTTNGPLLQSNGVGTEKVASPTEPQDSNKPRKPRKNYLLKILSCIRPAKEDEGPVSGHRRHRAAADSSGSDQEEVEQIVTKLTKITDSVHFLPTEIETDSGDVVERIVEILREHGDKLNEKMEKDHSLKKLLSDNLSFAFFSKVTQTFLQRLSPEELSAVEDRKQAEVALTCELTSRLNALDCHPMNRVLGFGAKYLHDYFSPWVNQQGGYENVFSTDRDSEEDVQ